MVNKFKELALELDKTDCTSETHKEAFERLQKLARTILNENFIADDYLSVTYSKEDILEELQNEFQTHGVELEPKELKKLESLMDKDFCQGYSDAMAEITRQSIDEERESSMMMDFLPDLLEGLIGRYDDRNSDPTKESVMNAINRKLLKKKINQIV